MEMNWSTFILEIINFLVLIWILKHFLYKPVMNTITTRQSSIEEKLADARNLQTEAETLRSQYQGRLADWEQERQQARDQLNQEIETERSRKLQELSEVLEQEQEKSRVAQQHLYANELRKMEEMALQNGSRFVTRILEQVACPELETRLIEMLVSRLDNLPEEERKKLVLSNEQQADKVVIRSAYPVDNKQRQQLARALNRLTTTATTINYEQDSALLAGVRITIGAWVLAASLQDELKLFSDLAHAE